MARMLDARTAFRLPIVIAGIMLAGGRRTAANWFRAAGVKDDWDRFYDLPAEVGRPMVVTRRLLPPATLSVETSEWLFWNTEVATGRHTPAAIYR